MTISSAVWIECTDVTDGRTYRQTADDSKDRAYTQRGAVKMLKLDENDSESRDSNINASAYIHWSLSLVQ